MKQSNLINLTIIGLCLWGIYYLNPGLLGQLLQSKPCVNPLEFSIGTFDTQFGISQATFIADIEQAGQVWEKAYGKELFRYNPNANFKINLIYDRRQQVTNELKNQDVSISNDRLSYDSLKDEYDALVLSYNSKKAEYENERANVEAEQAALNKQIQYWNSRGGAPKQEYNDLQEQRAQLSAHISSLNQTKEDLNSTSDQINKIVPLLNSLAQKLNLKVAVFNTISSSNGEEFSEGEYIEDNSGPHINVYQFDSKAQLIRLLEHELGHSLGLEHVEDSEAVMYYLNNSNASALTESDINELYRVCEK